MADPYKRWKSSVKTGFSVLLCAVVILGFFTLPAWEGEHIIGPLLRKVFWGTQGIFWETETEKDKEVLRKVVQWVHANWSFITTSLAVILNIIICGVLECIWKVSGLEVSPTKRPTILSKSCLLKDEQIVQRRLAELENRQERIRSARELVGKEMLGEQRIKALDMYDTASSLLKEQRSRYRVMLKMGDLIMKENEVRALKADWEEMTDNECEYRLRILSGHWIPKSEKLLKDFEAQTELANSSAGKNYLTRVREFLLDCQELRQALAVQLTVVATKGIAGMTPEVGTRLDDLDINARATIERYYNGFQALEDEYARLEFDAETARQLKVLEG